jgi:hypothetical protein
VLELSSHTMMNCWRAILQETEMETEQELRKSISPLLPPILVISRFSQCLDLSPHS